MKYLLDSQIDLEMQVKTFTPLNEKYLGIPHQRNNPEYGPDLKYDTQQKVLVLKYLIQKIFVLNFTKKLFL